MELMQHAQVFDTGSSDMFLAGPKAPTISRRFDSSQSKTFQDTRIPWTTSFADGTGADGELVKDTVKIGGFSVPGHRFALAETPMYDMLTGRWILCALSGCSTWDRKLRRHRGPRIYVAQQDQLDDLL
jgi:hypothetical protein